jgi:hypothetical protein
VADLVVVVAAMVAGERAALEVRAPVVMGGRGELVVAAPSPWRICTLRSQIVS